MSETRFIQIDDNVNIPFRYSLAVDRLLTIGVFCGKHIYKIYDRYVCCEEYVDVLTSHTDTVHAWISK